MSRYAAAGQTTGASAIYTSTTNNPAIDIQVTEPSGNSGTATFERVTFTNDSSAWLQKWPVAQQAPPASVDVSLLIGALLGSEASIPR